jgi:polyhydroxybutyrate depolymerase
MPITRRLDPALAPLTTALVSALFVASCVAATGSVAPSASTASPSVSPMASAVVPAESPTPPPPTPAAVKLEEPVFTFDGDARRVRLYRPLVMPSSRVPLLIFLHASGETPAAAAMETGFDRLAGQERFIAVFPPAANGAWEAQVTAGLSDSQVDQVWLTKLLDDLLAKEPIDPRRVFVAGFSKGAVMTVRMACVLADRIAATAVVGGAPWIGGACKPSKPVSMLFVHGTADSTLRISGARQVADQWRSLDGCEPAPGPSPMGAKGTVQTNDRCRGRTVVEFVTVQDGSHAWFTEPDTTALAWDFLTEHARP